MSYLSYRLGLLFTFGLEVRQSKKRGENQERRNAEGRREGRRGGGERGGERGGEGEVKGEERRR